MFPRAVQTTWNSAFKTLLATTVAGAAVLCMHSQAMAQSGRRTLAQAQTQNAPAAAPSDKLDVSDLEKKYWAAKDNDFSVVQNRLFSKTGRVALSAQYGMLLTDSWSEGPTFGANLNYYFSERYGLELSYSTSDLKDNESTQTLRAQFGVPDHNKMKDFYGLSFNWVPFYAKVSVLNSKIIYFDMAVSPGVGMVSYEQQIQAGNVTKTTPAVTLDVTQSFFLNRWFAVRLDYKNRWYQQEIVSYRNTGNKRNDLNNTSLFMLGFTLFY